MEAYIKSVINSQYSYIGTFIEELDRQADYERDPIEISFEDRTFIFERVEFDYGDGDGASMSFVFKALEVQVDAIPREVGFFMTTGTRSSWSDHSYDDDVTRVYPEQVTITRYVKR